MLQTHVWHGTRGTAKAGLALWWRRYRSVLLPQTKLILGALALLCGALLAVSEYERHLAEVRLAETSRFLDQYRSGPVADALARLGAAWQAESTRQTGLLAELRAPGGRDPAAVRRDHQLFVLEVIEERRLQPDIEVVRQFVLRLATCVRVGSCDRTAAAAQLGPALWAFHEQHRPYFRFESGGAELEAHLVTIAPRPAVPSDAVPSR